MQRNVVFTGTPRYCLQCEYDAGYAALAGIMAREKGVHRGACTGGSRGTPSAGLLGQVKVKAYNEYPTIPFVFGPPHHRHVCRSVCDVNLLALKQHSGRLAKGNRSCILRESNPGLARGRGLFYH